MRLGIGKILELKKKFKERKRLLKDLQIQDLVNFGVKEKNRTEDPNLRDLHIYGVGMLRYEEAHLDDLHRTPGTKAEALRLKRKLGLVRRTLFDTWKAEIDRYKGKDIGLEFIYYETVGRYISLVKK